MLWQKPGPGSDFHALLDTAGFITQANSEQTILEFSILGPFVAIEI